MKLEINIDESCTETSVRITARAMDEELSSLISRLSEPSPRVLIGFRGDEAEILEQACILHVYAENGKVYASTEHGTFLVRLRLYEVEERLDKQRFVRISNAEIVNLNKVRSFDLSFSGTICVQLCDDTQAYVSRRYVSKIKQTLGL